MANPVTLDFSKAQSIQSSPANDSGVALDFSKAQSLESQPSVASRVGNFVNSPLPSAAAQAVVPGAGVPASITAATQPGIDALVQKEINDGNPFRAGLASFLAGVNRSVTNLERGFTSPASIATMIGGPISRGASALAAVYFGWRGAQAAITPQQLGESYADALERRLGGASTALFSAAGGYATGKDVAHNLIRNGMGITGQLAERVQAKVDLADALQRQNQADIANATQRYQSTLNAENANEETQQATLQNNIRTTFSRTLADAAQAVQQEHARVTLPFIEIANDSKGAVSTATDVKALLSNSLKDFQVQDKEVPAGALKALSNRGNLTASDVYVGEEGNPTGTPLMKVSNDENNDLNFYDVTRIKDDFYDAAGKASDGAVAAALNQAAGKLDDMQNEYANKNGFGQKYRAAKGQYMIFKRELGSGLMNDWLSANDVQEQAIAPKLAQLTSPARGEALRTVLSKVGIDLRPLDQLIAESKNAESGAKGIEKEHAETVKRIQETTKSALSGMNKDEPIVPGMQDLQLQGMSENEISGLRVRALAKKMQGKGITNPLNLVMITYGLLEMASGRPYGAFPAGYGFIRGGIPKVVLSPAFQDWVVRDAGIEPTNKLMSYKVKQGIASLYPILRRATAAQIPAASTASSRNKVPPR